MNLNSETHCTLKKLVEVAGKKRHRGQVPTSRKLVKKLNTVLKQDTLPFDPSNKGDDMNYLEAVEMALEALEIDRMVNPTEEPYKTAMSLFTAAQANLNTVINSHRRKDVSDHAKQSTALVAAKALRLLTELEREETEI